jgi:histidyl-tRNA synthetase
MTQPDLNRAVAVITGDFVSVIDEHGFGFVEVPVIERDPLFYDGDDADARAFGSTFD